jgi:hypothetical protein
VSRAPEFPSRCAHPAPGILVGHPIQEGHWPQPSRGPDSGGAENFRSFRGTQMVEARTQPVVKCPIRPADACSLCLPGASGPQDCGLVYLVMSDPDLRERLHDIRSRSL